MPEIPLDQLVHVLEVQTPNGAASLHFFPKDLDAPAETVSKFCRDSKNGWDRPSLHEACERALLSESALQPLSDVRERIGLPRAIPPRRIRQRVAIPAVRMIIIGIYDKVSSMAEGS